MLKVLEHGDGTASFESLLRLLATPPATVAADADAAARFRELVVKCLIKLTKALGATLCRCGSPSSCWRSPLLRRAGRGGDPAARARPDGTSPCAW